jgi:AcrR family transcriptional regulator
MDVSQDSAVEASAETRDVRERLLEAAEQLFGDRGFGGTTVRDLAAAAKCNIAAVNYHFGSKEKLYTELWRRLLIHMRDVRLDGIAKVMSEAQGRPTLEELLRAFGNAFLGPFLDEPRASRVMKLMAREMIDQHLPANMFMDDIITPTMAAMGGALHSVCPELGKEMVPLVLFSLVGQLIHLVRMKAMSEHLQSNGIPIFNLATGIDHIVAFSAAGIRAYSNRRETEDNNG